MNKDPRIEKIENLLDKLGNIAVEAFHYIALFI
ncbi:MAG: phosphate starvation protein, partial [Pseudomonadota bacterium]